MSPTKRLSFSLNPLWTHYIASIALALALLGGAWRYIFIDYFDPLRCGALLSTGRWLDNNLKNWQPEGCMMHTYQPKDASSCLSGRSLVFIGDSITRKLFFQVAHIVDLTLPTAPPDDQQKHAHHTFRSSNGIQLSFFWDPFLNSSQTIDTLTMQTDSKDVSSQRPALLVLGSGLWYLRYSDSSGGLSAWEANVERTLNAITRTRSQVADEVVLLPIEEVVSAKLSRERANTMHISDIDAMNSDLYHRINPPSSDSLRLFYPSQPSMPVSHPRVFNRMLDPSQTTDGLHFSDAIINVQANILLNLRCNDILPKKFPLDKTCCRRYPWPSAVHFILLVAVILWGPYVLLMVPRQTPTAPIIRDDQWPPLIYSGVIGLMFLADRTSFWLKEQKQFSPWAFTVLSALSFAIGLGTIKRADKDLGFMNREQTDEWKGWMQIAILIYHYLGASKVSGIYNPIRVLVAAYLFMTGYGHTMFYIRKADFGFSRLAQVMIRLNLFTSLLAYAMNTNYISYYFTPLVSMWFLIIYGTMALGSQYNDRLAFLVCKFLVSMCLVTWFMNEPWLLETLFRFLRQVFAIRWSAQEWSFRVNLDLWIVYFGMFTALAVIKLREYRITEHPRWALLVKLSVVASGVVMLWFMAFELLQPSKFAYNQWHPYVSFLPIAAFVILRNASAILRSASSRAFAFIGRCSLETFIIQFHFWLAADTKGILIVIPATQWRYVNLVITTLIFVYASHRVAQATGEITKWICDDEAKKTLPTTAEGPSNQSSSTLSGPAAQEEVPLVSQPDERVRKDVDGTDIAREPNSPLRPIHRWADRLAEGTSDRPSSKIRDYCGDVEWKPGLKARVALGLSLMWLLNVIWPYS